MQTIYLHDKVYQINKIDESEYEPEVFERLEKLKLFKKLINEGCRSETALEAIKTTRATYYRWIKRYKEFGLAGLENESRRPNKVRKPRWTIEAERIVIEKRKQYKLWGKHKLAVIIKRELGVVIKPSTIGRILKKAMDRGIIKSVAFSCGKREVRRRVFNDHAKRWSYGMKPEKHGELVQIDHMTVSLQGLIIKHFKAIDPTTKIVVEQAYRTATSGIASEFLKKVVMDFPFPIKSIQVDGGSEFMGEFEQACKVLTIPLYVLPPRSPEYNGCVERGNGTVKYEFYQQYNGLRKLENIQQSLQKYVQHYNTWRPHQALKYLTPIENYIALTKQAPLSHMY